MSMCALPAHLNQRILSLLDCINHLNHVKQLQAFLTAIGHSQTPFYAFKLVRFSVLALSNLHYARSIFNHLQSPNVYLYAAMVTAYASEPDNLSAFALYCDMVRRGNPPPNEFVYPHVLKSCSAVFGASRTELVHTQILKSGFGRYPVVQTALMDSYSRVCTNVGNAKKIFDEMGEKTVVSWTAMVSGFARMGDIGNAMKLFEEMPERDVPSWNAVIAGCTQNGSFYEAIWFFKKLISFALKQKRNDFKPNQVTVVCALSACGHTGMLQLGTWMHGYIYRNGVVLDAITLNALLDMYGKCGNLKIARKLFDMNWERRSLTAWNSMINSLALHGQLDCAISVFEKMMESKNDVKPNEVTFVSLLNACTHAGLVEKGYHYFHLMTREFGIEPRVEHYGCLVDLLGRAGRFEEAFKIISNMRPESDEVVWGSLLNGCKIHGRTDLAELVAKKLIEIDPDNGGYGIMLANIYLQQGKYDEVRRVRKILKERSALKIPGCSWIEVDDQIFQFYSVDKTHPRISEICKMLQNLFGSQNEIAIQL